MLLVVSTGLACGGGPYDCAYMLAEGAGERTERLEAKLRAAGPEGMDALAAARAELVADMELLKRPDAAPGAWEAAAKRLAAFDASMDRVGGARYCSRSQLYWYTDYEAAQAAAQKQGKPILTLRLLGNLTDEFSCANSRFFRTTLYANEEVSKLLRENFVLHWKSVRPVPVVTIDFGDGRKLQRTLTGNSIHYVLTSDGQVVDALPGLYGPKAFQSQLHDALAAVKRLAETDPAEQNATRATYHREKLTKLESAWAADLAKVSLNSALVQVRNGELPPPRQAEPTGNAPHALRAAQVAAPKRAVEARLIANVVPPPTEPAALDDEKTWAAIAALHAEEAQLDPASRALIASENPTAAQAGILAVTKARVESPLVRMFRSFQGAIALDTVKNEYQMHRTIHQWLTEASYRPDVETLNERVYAELFLTPRSDPWLGLAPADAYTALPNAGLTQASAKGAK